MRRHSERGVLWKNLADGSFDRCALTMTLEGLELRGEVLNSDDKNPVHISYLVVCDTAWATQHVEVAWHEGAKVRELKLDVDDQKRWWQKGEEIESVRGCVDVDLGITPATNTLPIRRLAPQVGKAVDVTAAWVRFPDLNVEPLPQTYTRLGEDLYRYESNGGTFTAEISVDELGLVTLYAGGWERVSLPGAIDGGYERG